MRKATDVFREWAETGKDLGMQEGHALSVNEMITFALKERSEIDKSFSFLLRLWCILLYLGFLMNQKLHQYPNLELRKDLELK